MVDLGLSSSMRTVSSSVSGRLAASGSSFAFIGRNGCLGTPMLKRPKPREPPKPWLRQGMICWFCCCWDLYFCSSFSWYSMARALLRATRSSSLMRVFWRASERSSTPSHSLLPAGVVASLLVMLALLVLLLLALGLLRGRGPDLPGSRTLGYTR